MSDSAASGVGDHRGVISKAIIAPLLLFRIAHEPVTELVTEFC
jgi:hypothetical protein